MNEITSEKDEYALVGGRAGVASNGSAGCGGYPMSEEEQRECWRLTAEANKVFPSPIPGRGGSCWADGTPYFPPKTMWGRISEWFWSKLR